MNYNNYFELAEKKNITNLEIMEILTKELSLELFDKEIDNYQLSDTTSYKVKGTYNNKDITISTEILTEDILEKIIKNSEYLEENKTRNSQLSRETIIYKNNYNLSNPSEIIERLQSLNQLKKKYKDLKNINTFYNESINKIKIITKDTIEEDINMIYYFGVEAFAKIEEKTSNSISEKKSTENNIDIESITEKTIQDAILNLDNKPIKAGKYNIILENKVVASLLNSFIPMFTADSIQKDTSLLSGKQNKKICSSKVNLIEDPTNEKMVGKRLFDDRGTKTSYKEIIKNGVFKTILYDEKTANIDKTKLTGNDYGRISVRNLYLKPGRKSLDDILKENNDIIMISSVSGLHAGVNITNGNISLQSEGYILKDGTRTSIKLFVLATDIFELLNNIKEIANDLDNTYQTVSSPSILVENIKISV